MAQTVSMHVKAINYYLSTVWMRIEIYSEQSL
jgi:hypothetical protein